MLETTTAPVTSADDQPGCIRDKPIKPHESPNYVKITIAVGIIAVIMAAVGLRSDLMLPARYTLSTSPIIAKSESTGDGGLTTQDLMPGDVCVEPSLSLWNRIISISSPWQQIQYIQVPVCDIHENDESISLASNTDPTLAKATDDVASLNEMESDNTAFNQPNNVSWMTSLKGILASLGFRTLQITSTNNKVSFETNTLVENNRLDLPVVEYIMIKLSSGIIFLCQLLTWPTLILLGAFVARGTFLRVMASHEEDLDEAVTGEDGIKKETVGLNKDQSRSRPVPSMSSISVDVTEAELNVNSLATRFMNYINSITAPMSTDDGDDNENAHNVNDVWGSQSDQGNSFQTSNDGIGSCDFEDTLERCARLYTMGVSLPIDVEAIQNGDGESGKL
ncbi:hypothetical protein HDU76_003489 [Blyttiomyces sp. JEL0837]|nr:hypothetical protein HDU76_003489 [Blyttiomyces sp. JEL0837]